MLGAIKNLFVRDRGPVDGKVTLDDVLRRNWFELWYQPKIDLRTMRLAGAEALVRARKPDGGMVAPGVFLPGASEQQMLALTERVILTATRLGSLRRAWHASEARRSMR